MKTLNKMEVFFYRSLTGKEPVRDWLISLTKEDKKTIGEDIKTLQFGWPLGMPLVRKMDKGLWEIRTTLREGIARIFFTSETNKIILLHGFIKKAQKTPNKELETAKNRMIKLKETL